MIKWFLAKWDKYSTTVFNNSKVCTSFEHDSHRWWTCGSVLLCTVRVACNRAHRTRVKVVCCQSNSELELAASPEVIGVFEPLFCLREMEHRLRRAAFTLLFPICDPSALHSHLYVRSVSCRSSPSPSLNDQLFTSGLCANVTTSVSKTAWSRSAKLPGLSYFLCNLRRSPQAM